MSRAELLQPRKYYTIIDGNFRTQVPQNHPGAVRRDWKSADGKSFGTKYELVYRALYGYITDVSFADGEFGMQVFIKLDKDVEGEEPTIALNASSREAESFMKKLPNIDLSQEVQLRPFSFVGKQDGNEVRGMNVAQPDEFGDFRNNVLNFFWDAEKKQNINGFPNPDGDTSKYSKDDWKIYFMLCRKFLINYINDSIRPKFATITIPATPTRQMDNLNPSAIDAAFDAAVDEIGGIGKMPATP